MEVQPTSVLNITSVPRCFSVRAEQGTLKVNKVMVNSLEDTLGKNQTVSWTLNTQWEYIVFGFSPVAFKTNLKFVSLPRRKTPDSESCRRSPLIHRPHRGTEKSWTFFFFNLHRWRNTTMSQLFSTNCFLWEVEQKNSHLETAQPPFYFIFFSLFNTQFFPPLFY